MWTRSGVKKEKEEKEELECTLSSLIDLALYIPDFRPRSRFSRSGCRRFMRALRVLLTEYLTAQGDYSVSTYFA
ncbi:hypothetical protein VN97_g8311 [Penicillium thymicola]|uniref:Uncharacterized protein n=1 Tax=Penicillium thymicola TaxID=293382 RepID=A0AAI9TCZ5_PENTH|nr:hypothetical protein VN97_g8311 [Penicillium thymicola]